MTTNFTIEGLTIAVNDMTKMLVFYTNVFNIEFEEKLMYGSSLYSGKWSAFDLLLCPATIARNTATQNKHQFDIIVPNLQELTATAIASGGELMGEITETQAHYSVGVYDPDKNSILFKQYK